MTVVLPLQVDCVNLIDWTFIEWPSIWTNRDIRQITSTKVTKFSGVHLLIEMLIISPPYSSGKLNVSNHYCYALGVDGTEVSRIKWTWALFLRIFKDTSNKGLCSTLQRFNCGYCPSHRFSWIVFRNLFDLCIKQTIILAKEYTRRANGNFRINKSVDRWYLRISLRANVPGRNLRLLGFIAFTVLFSVEAGFFFCTVVFNACTRRAIVLR